MILNAKNNNFRFEFPRNFFEDNITKEYEYIIKRLPCPYKTIRDYVNASIQEVTFPSVSLPKVEQQSLHNPEIPWKGKGNLELNIDKEITVTFKLYEGFVNYWIMFEHLDHFYKYTTRKQFLPDMFLMFLDNTGYELFTIKFGRIIYNGISDLSLSFATNVPEFNTFTCDFTYTSFNLLKREQ